MYLLSCFRVHIHKHFHLSVDKRFVLIVMFIFIFMFRTMLTFTCLCAFIYAFLLYVNLYVYLLVDLFECSNSHAFLMRQSVTDIFMYTMEITHVYFCTCIHILFMHPHILGLGFLASHSGV